MSNKVEKDTNDVNVETGVLFADEDSISENFIGECGWFSIADDHPEEDRIITDSAIQEKTPRLRIVGRRFSFRTFYYFVMRKHWAELCLSMSLILTILTSIFHSQYAMKAHLMQRKAPLPVRFFPRNSPVTDFYDGNGFDLHKLLSMQGDRRGSTGVLFVMYYAPWCARSMDAKWHVDNLARYFYPDSSISDSISENGTRSTSSNGQSRGPVHFIAVNCWDPNGECRRAYKLYTYPVFLVYPGTTSGIYYNGVIAADYMFRFLENIISPFVRVQNDDDIEEALNDYRTVAIAYFDFAQRHPDGYLAFYSASLKALERDPLRAATKFVVITHPNLASRRLNFTTNGQLILARYLNETNLDYPDEAEFSGKAISAWIFENLSNPIRWVSPSTAGAGKSTALFEFLTRKPTLILFAPRQPLFDSGSSYASIVDVALNYFNCTHEDVPSRPYPSTNATLERFHRLIRESMVHRRQLTELCLRKLREETRLLKDCCDDISNIIRSGQQSLYDYRQRNICHVCYSDASSTSRINDPLFSLSSASSCNRFFTSEDFIHTMSPATKQFLTPIFSSRSCDRLINDFLPKPSVIDFCCRNSGHGTSAIERRKKLKRTLTHLDSGNGGRATIPNCEKLQLSRVLRYVHGQNEKMISNRGKSDWNGLACRTNRTLQFAAMDSNYYGVFVRKLGLRVKNSASVAAIVDNQNEVTYVLEDATSADRLGAFIINFTLGHLKQFYRSEFNGQFNNHSLAVEPRNCTPGTVCVQVITSSTFPSIVLDPAKEVLLFYTARWCGACQRLFSMYQTLAYYFRVVEYDIMFAQLDITNNDLPWQYTIDHVPSLIFYPAGRKSESALFPSYAPWTLPNLVAFVLAHCQHGTRLRFALSTCIRNTTGHSTSVDTRCLVRNRYRAWRQLAQMDRKIRFLRLEMERAIQVTMWDWDYDEDEWQVYLERTWLEIRDLEMKRRALRRLVDDALSRNHFV